jgi:hypothetical protein
MKFTFTVALVLALATFSACNKSQNPAQSQSPTPSKSSDAIRQKLQELAGSGATDCGGPKSQNAAEVQPATDCAMKAAQNKQPFYVRYDLPGMTTAMAGDAQGKLYAVQTEANGQVQSTACPAEIRVAQSGRVTCYAAGSMGGMGTMGGASPHGGGMGMPPASGPNPHEGSAAPSHGSPQGKSQKP